MPVNDEQVTVLRSQLAGDFEEHKRLLRELDAAGGLHDYMGLVSAAFLEAVDRRFGSAELPAAVVDWVGEARARSEEAAEGIDPTIAERVVLKALGHGEIGDINGRDIRCAVGVLLPILVADEHLGDAELDAFLAIARKRS